MAGAWISGILARVGAVTCTGLSVLEERYYTVSDGVARSSSQVRIAEERPGEDGYRQKAGKISDKLSFRSLLIGDRLQAPRRARSPGWDPGSRCGDWPW
jgi:hypothetical protein